MLYIVCVLRKLKFIIKQEILEKIYLTFIRPLLEYSCEVWDNCSPTDNDRQLEAARIVTGLTVYSSRNSLSYLLVFLVSLSRLFQRFMTDGRNED
jgi:hypothetical protein